MTHPAREDLFRTRTGGTHLVRAVVVEEPLADGVHAIAVSDERALVITPADCMELASAGIADRVAAVLDMAAALVEHTSGAELPALEAWQTTISIVTATGVTSTSWAEDQLWRCGGRHLDLYRAVLGVRDAVTMARAAARR